MNTSWSCKSTSIWDENFFEDFVLLQNRLHINISHHVLEDTKDFKVLFGPNGIFNASFSWRAFLVYSRNNIPVARFLLSAPKSRSKQNFLAFGYFESVKDENLLTSLQREITDQLSLWKRDQNELKSVKAPLDVHFFKGYRMKATSLGPSFYGEPQNLDYYPHFFASLGFHVSGTWESLKITEETARQHFLPFWEKMKPRWQREGIAIRRVNLKRWPEELKHLFELIVDSYQNMQAFAPIKFETFKSLYADYRPLIDSRYFLFASREGEDLGFLIGLRDPLEALCTLQHRCTRWPWFSPLWKLLALKKARKSKRLLVFYVGKKTKDRRALWLVPSLGAACYQNAIQAGIREATICYLASDSPARVGLPKGLPITATYTLYEKNLI
ncbi:MAG: hypothetical protein KDD22_01485 [Bdellovibrionales bacterium]|nr:hypothetical protein [Bdellovibrionales bacterium]